MADKETSAYAVRSPTRDEMQQVVDIINAEGWNTHLEILYDIYDLQPEASKVVVDSNGQVLSHCCFVSLDDANANVTGFITKDGYRGQGLGKLVWEACKKQTEGKNLFINSIIPVIPVYEKQGATLPSPCFEMCEIFVPLKKQFNDQFLKEIDNNSCSVKTLNSTMLGELDKYDATFHCIKRSHFLRTHLNKCDIVKVAYDENNVICGYSCIREGYDGYSLMPLYAENTTIAKKLLHSLVMTIPDGTLLKICVCDGNATDVEEVLRFIGYEAKPYDPGHHAKRLFTIADSPITSVHRVFSTMNYQYSLV